MTKKETTKALRILATYPRLHVMGSRAYSNGLGGHRSFALDVIDTISGYTFVINTLDDLIERDIR